MNHTPITLNNIVPKDASYDCSAGTPLSCYQIPSTLKWTRCPICEGARLLRVLWFWNGRKG